MGQPDQDCHRTELPEKDCQHRAAKIRHPGQDRKEKTTEKTAITGELDRTARSIQPERDSQNRTFSTGQAVRRDRKACIEQDS
jgi:hypothetical protein